MATAASKAAKQPTLEEMIERAYGLGVMIAKLDAEREELRAKIAAALPPGTGAVKAGNAQAQMRYSVVPQIANEAAFLKWALLKANRDVLKVGVVADAYKARVTAGVKVPGIEPFNRSTLYITKA